eukprot:g4667.t1
MAKDEEKDDDKKDEEKKEDEEKDDDKDDDDDDDDGAASDDESEDEDEERMENGQKYSDEAKEWSQLFFQDTMHMRFYEVAKSRSDTEMTELQDGGRKWRYSIRNVKYTHKWEGEGDDIFIQFNIGYDFELKKVAKRDANGKRQVKWKTSGKMGKTHRTERVMNMKPNVEYEYYNFDENHPIQMSYFDLYDKKLRVEVWDWNWLTPNMFLGSMEISLLDVARSPNLTMEFDVSQTVMERKRRKVHQVGSLSFTMIFQEDLQYMIHLQNWGAQLKTTMLEEKREQAGEGDSCQRRIQAQFSLGKAGGILPDFRGGKRVSSTVEVVEYAFEEQLVMPLFKIRKALSIQGTRIDLEDHILQAQLYMRPPFGMGTGTQIGEGKLPLRSCSDGVYIRSNLNWDPSGKGVDVKEAGAIFGSVDVTCRRQGTKKENTLWREFKQRGDLNPPELRVYKGPRGGTNVYEQCYLVVKIIRGEKLLGVDESGFSDPYFVAEWAGQRCKTNVKFQDLDPVYNESMYFPIRCFTPSCPRPEELAANPVVNIQCWDYDEAGSADSLGTGKLYLCQITGPAPKGMYSKQFGGMKQQVPKRIHVRIRDGEGKSLRKRVIETRTFRGPIKLEDGVKGSDAAVRVEAYFHGPGYWKREFRQQRYKRKIPKCTSTGNLPRYGDLLEPPENMRRIKERGSYFLYLPYYGKDQELKAQKFCFCYPDLAEKLVDEHGDPLDTPGGRMYCPPVDVDEGGDRQPGECESVTRFFRKLKGALHGKRSLGFYEAGNRYRQGSGDGCEGIECIWADNQYDMRYLIPTFLQEMVPPAGMIAGPEETERLICIDSMKPNTCLHIAQFMKLFEFEFDDDDPNALKQWCAPDYFLEQKKGDIKCHALLHCSLLLGIKVDAYVCVGQAMITNDGDDELTPHVWIMTRESTSEESAAAYDQPDIAKNGGVKFWECTSGTYAPVLPNRWGGQDDEKAFQKAISKGKLKKPDKKKKPPKPRKKRVVIDKALPPDEPDEEAQLPDEEHMIHGYDESKSHRTDTVVDPSAIFALGAGLGESWGKPREQDILAQRHDENQLRITKQKETMRQ